MLVAGDLAEDAVLAEQRHDDELREEARLDALEQPVRRAGRRRARRTRSPTSARGRARRARRRSARPAAASARAAARRAARVRSTRPCSSSSCSVARPAAIASSFGANVEPCENGVLHRVEDRLVHGARHEQRADGDVAAGQRLRDRHEVRLELPVLEREQLPGAAEARSAPRRRRRASRSGGTAPARPRGSRAAAG